MTVDCSSKETIINKIINLLCDGKFWFATPDDAGKALETGLRNMVDHMCPR